VAFRRIKLPELYSHTDGDLHDDVSELMRKCACRSFKSIAWSSCRSLDLARSDPRRVSLASVVIHIGAGGRGEVDALEQGC
jgi:hypothetical protein